MQEFLEIIQGSRLFAGVDRAKTEALLACLDARMGQYHKGAYILRAGRPAELLGIVLEGQAHILHESFWGNRTVVNMLGPGSLFAESFACTPGAALSASIVAHSPVRVLLLDVQRVLAICSSACAFHNRVLQNLLADIAGKNIYFVERLTHMGQRTTRQKVLSYLSSEALRQGGPSFYIPYSRQQLADYLGVDRSAMSSELGRLRDEGVLRFKKSHFELLDAPHI